MEGEIVERQRLAVEFKCERWDIRQEICMSRRHGDERCRCLVHARKVLAGKQSRKNRASKSKPPPEGGGDCWRTKQR